MKYCLVFRTGGTENFKWHRTNEHYTLDEAILKNQEVQKMGYKSYVVKYQESKNIGLPETYEG
jgi:hypothetical protein